MTRWIWICLLVMLLVAVPVSATTNMVQYSQQFNSTEWTKTSTTVNLVDSMAAPDSTMTADAFNETSASASHYMVGSTGTYTTTNGQNYTTSVYLRASSTGTIRVFQLTFGTLGFPNRAYANFNLTSASVVKTVNVTNATITDAGSGWYRVTLTEKATADGGSITPVISFTNNNNNAIRIPSYVGSVLRMVYVWGAQSETGDTATTYTATNESIPGDPTVAAFSAGRVTGGTNAPITFTDSSTNTPTSWYWNFGDGNTSTLQNPTHVYSYAGTFEVDLKATNDYGNDWENKSAYLTIDTRPDSYLNPYIKMIPWLDQGTQGGCAGFAASYAAMLMRYESLGTAPSDTQEPFTRDVAYSVGGTTVYSDTHVNYTPSAASIYWPFDAAPGDHFNYTALAEVMKTGYNLQTDQITSKTIDEQFFYPQTEAYDDTHRYNPISDYTLQDDGNSTTWNLLKQNIADNHVVIVLIDTYGTNDNETLMTLDDGELATVMPAASGSATDGHYLAAVGYNNTLDQVYLIQSWGDDEGTEGMTWKKYEAMSKAYWTHTYSGSNRNAFIVPKDITINEELLLVGTVNATTVRINASFNAVPDIETAGTWSELRDGLGSSDNGVNTTAHLYAEIRSTAISNQYNFGQVGTLSFDTSVLPDNAVISSASLTGFAGSNGKTCTFGSCANASLTDYNKPSNQQTTFASTDYSQTTFARQAPDILYASWDDTLNAIKVFTIDPSKFSRINLTGRTGYMLDQSWRVDNTAPTWTSGKYMSYDYSPASNAAYVPYLTITYTLSDVIPPASITNLVNTSSCTSINWSWVNPPDIDFNLTRVYQNGTFLHNVTTPYDNWTGLVTGLLYEIGTSTCDITGNCNATFRNASAFPSCVLFPPSASFVSNVTCGNVPFIVQFNDTSLNSPTAWNWSSFNSENLINFSEQQNPIFGYNVSGLFSINFNATNAQGTNWSNRTDYIRAVPNWASCPPTPTPVPTWTLPIMPSTEVSVQPDNIFSYWYVVVGLLLVVFLVMKK